MTERENRVPLSPATIQALLPAAAEASTLDVGSDKAKREKKYGDKPSLEKAVSATNPEFDAVQSPFKSYATVAYSPEAAAAENPATTATLSMPTPTTEASEIEPDVSEAPAPEYSSTIPGIVLYEKQFFDGRFGVDWSRRRNNFFSYYFYEK